METRDTGYGNGRGRIDENRTSDTQTHTLHLGKSGKAERSMACSVDESVASIQSGDRFNLAPFVHTFFCVW